MSDLEHFRTQVGNNNANNIASADSGNSDAAADNSSPNSNFNSIASGEDSRSGTPIQDPLAPASGRGGGHGLLLQRHASTASGGRLASPGMSRDGSRVNLLQRTTSIGQHVAASGQRPRSSERITSSLRDAATSSPRSPRPTSAGAPGSARGAGGAASNTLTSPLDSQDGAVPRSSLYNMPAFGSGGASNGGNSTPQQSASDSTVGAGASAGGTRTGSSGSCGIESGRGAMFGSISGGACLPRLDSSGAVAGMRPRRESSSTSKATNATSMTHVSSNPPSPVPLANISAELGDLQKVDSSTFSTPAPVAAGGALAAVRSSGGCGSSSALRLAQQQQQQQLQHPHHHPLHHLQSQQHHHQQQQRQVQLASSPHQMPAGDSGSSSQGGGGGASSSLQLGHDVSNVSSGSSSAALLGMGFVPLVPLVMCPSPVTNNASSGPASPGVPSLHNNNNNSRAASPSLQNASFGSGGSSGTNPNLIPVARINHGVDSVTPRTTQSSSSGNNTNSNNNNNNNSSNSTNNTNNARPRPDSSQPASRISHKSLKTLGRLLQDLPPVAIENLGGLLASVGYTATVNAAPPAAAASAASASTPVTSPMSAKNNNNNNNLADSNNSLSHDDDKHHQHQQPPDPHSFDAAFGAFNASFGINAHLYTPPRAAVAAAAAGGGGGAAAAPDGNGNVVRLDLTQEQLITNARQAVTRLFDDVVEIADAMANSFSSLPDDLDASGGMPLFNVSATSPRYVISDGGVESFGMSSSPNSPAGRNSLPTGLSSSRIRQPRRLRGLEVEKGEMEEYLADVLKHERDELLLHQEHITEVPALVLTMKFLRVVSMSKNNIVVLPKELFTQLPHLEELDLSENRIEVVPNELFTACPTLDKLSLDHNKLTYFGITSMGATSSSSSNNNNNNNNNGIDIRSSSNHNNDDDDDQQILPAPSTPRLGGARTNGSNNRWNLPVLREVGLDWNNLQQFPIEALEMLPALQRLYLSENVNMAVCIDALEAMLLHTESSSQTRQQLHDQGVRRKSHASVDGGASLTNSQRRQGSASLRGPGGTSAPLDIALRRSSESRLSAHSRRSDSPVAPKQLRKRSDLSGVGGEAPAATTDHQHPPPPPLPLLHQHHPNNTPPMYQQHLNVITSSNSKKSSLTTSPLIRGRPFAVEADLAESGNINNIINNINTINNNNSGSNQVTTSGSVGAPFMADLASDDHMASGSSAPGAAVAAAASALAGLVSGLDSGILGCGLNSPQHQQMRTSSVRLIETAFDPEDDSQNLHDVASDADSNRALKMSITRYSDDNSPNSHTQELLVKRKGGSVPFAEPSQLSDSGAASPPPPVNLPRRTTSTPGQLQEQLQKHHELNQQQQQQQQQQRQAAPGLAVQSRSSSEKSAPGLKKRSTINASHSNINNSKVGRRSFAESCGSRSQLRGRSPGVDGAAAAAAACGGNSMSLNDPALNLSLTDHLLINSCEYVAQNPALAADAADFKEKTSADMLLIRLDNSPESKALFHPQVVALLREDHYILVDWNEVYPDEIAEGLYLGGVTSVHSPYVFQQLNITHVLTAARDVNAVMCSGIQHKKLLLDDFPNEDITAVFDDAHKFIDQARKPQQPGAAPSSVVVHCFMGVSRSATIVISYLMREHGFAMEDALEYVRERRPKVCPNDGFLNALRRYESVLLQKRQPQKKQEEPLRLQSDHLAQLELLHKQQQQQQQQKKKKKTTTASSLSSPMQSNQQHEQQQQQQQQASPSAMQQPVKGAFGAAAATSFGGVLASPSEGTPVASPAMAAVVVAGASVVDGPDARLDSTGFLSSTRTEPPFSPQSNNARGESPQLRDPRLQQQHDREQDPSEPLQLQYSLNGFAPSTSPVTATSSPAGSAAALIRGLARSGSSSFHFGGAGTGTATTGSNAGSSSTAVYGHRGSFHGAMNRSSSSSQGALDTILEQQALNTTTTTNTTSSSHVVHLTSATTAGGISPTAAGGVGGGGGGGGGGGALSNMSGSHSNLEARNNSTSTGSAQTQGSCSPRSEGAEGQSAMGVGDMSRSSEALPSVLASNNSSNTNRAGSTNNTVSSGGGGGSGGRGISGAPAVLPTTRVILGGNPHSPVQQYPQQEQHQQFVSSSNIGSEANQSRSSVDTSAPSINTHRSGVGSRVGGGGGGAGNEGGGGGGGGGGHDAGTSSSMITVNEYVTATFSMSDDEELAHGSRQQPARPLFFTSSQDPSSSLTVDGNNSVNSPLGSRLADRPYSSTARLERTSSRMSNSSTNAVNGSSSVPTPPAMPRPGSSSSLRFAVSPGSSSNTVPFLTHSAAGASSNNSGDGQRRQ